MLCAVWWWGVGTGSDWTDVRGMPGLAARSLIGHSPGRPPPPLAAAAEPQTGDLLMADRKMVIYFSAGNRNKPQKKHIFRAS